METYIHLVFLEAYSVHLTLGMMGQWMVDSIIIKITNLLSSTVLDYFILFIFFLEEEFGYEEMEEDPT